MLHKHSVVPHTAAYTHSIAEVVLDAVIYGI